MTAGAEIATTDAGAKVSLDGVDLRELVRSSAAPRALVARIAMAVVLAKSLMIWLLPRFLLKEPLAVTALYWPGGDMYYYEIVSALAHGNVGESNVAELTGQGVQAFPFAIVSVHALCFAVLGIWGFLVADVLATYAFHVVLVLTLRLARLPERVATLLSLCVVASLPLAVSVVTERIGFGKFLMWGERFPRPLLAETLLLGGVCVASALVAQRRNPPRAPFWVIAGVALGLLLQGDIYGAFVVMQVVGIVFAWIVLRAEPVERRTWLRGSAVGVLAMGLTLVPFALQRVGSHPDLARRFGLHAVSRTDALTWISLVPARVPAVVVVLGGAVLLWITRTAPTDEDRLRRPVLLQWLALVLVAYVSLPLFCLILGRAIQLYHFPDRLSRFASYAICIIVAHACLRLTRAASWSEQARARAVMAASAIVMLAASGGIVARSWLNARNTAHMRASYFHFESLGSYRAAFSELVGELESGRYRDVDVLATFDHQVQAYWQSFHDGHSFVPDLFVSTVTDAEAERRLAAMCAAVGMNGPEFETFVQKAWVNTFWLGLAKYATNRQYALFPRSAYTEAQIADMNKRNLDNAWHVSLPPIEVERLRRVFEETAPRWSDVGRLQAIVLTKDAELARYAPDPTAFDLSFENSVFRVYRRR